MLKPFYFIFAFSMVSLTLYLSVLSARSTQTETEMSSKKDQSPRSAASGTVVIDGGYQIEGVDMGRPVRLIAAALKVKPEVFREAFSNVRPERGAGGPSPALARENKSVLLKALGKHGVTNERLDEVSDFYRYRPGRDELWKHSPAFVEAVVVNNEVTELKIVRPGSGYSSEPKISIIGYENLNIKTTLRFTSDLKTNGSLASVSIEKPAK